MKINKLRKVITVILSLIALVILFVGFAYILIHRSNGKIVSSGQTRKYILYVPDSYDPSTPTPLVISMHGFADWPAHHMRVSGWPEIADEYGFIVVFPMGTEFPLRWLTHTIVDEGGSPNQDVIFISDLIQKLKEDNNIDLNRVYANGLSNGGGMSHLLACTLEDQITAIGGVAGAYLFPWQECQTSRPVPVILFHGTDDEIVLYDGGSSDHSGVPFPAIPDFAAKWAEHNKCDLNAERMPSTNETSGIRYSNCEDNADVVFYTIHGGGHSWPGTSSLPKLVVGHTTQDMSASRMMWEFYQQYTLEK